MVRHEDVRRAIETAKVTPMSLIGSRSHGTGDEMPAALPDTSIATSNPSSVPDPSSV
jgi:hypothetical protein